LRISEPYTLTNKTNINKEKTYLVLTLRKVWISSFD